MKDLLPQPGISMHMKKKILHYVQNDKEIYNKKAFL